MVLRKFILGGLVAASLLFVLTMAACGGGDDEDDGGAANGGNGGPAGGPITILLKDNFYEPKDITVPVNTTVEITVKNEGTAVHNMHVLSKEKEGKDFTSDAIVNPGQSSTFEVTFTNKGTFDFQCDFHLPDMAGTITVE